MAITPNDFAQQLNHICPSWRRRPLIVAVSGGPDSLCLAWLLGQLQPKTLYALTIDHGLRPEAHHECLWTQQQLTRWGLETYTLKITEIPPKKGQLAWAREARYKVIGKWIQEQGFHEALVLVGHHQDDQYETILMRLERGSGPSGLAGMSARLPSGFGYETVRPLLAFTRAQIQETLAPLSINPIQDPSNENPNYRRIFMRQNRPIFESAGLTSKRIIGMGHWLGRCRHWAETEAKAFLEQHSHPHPWGVLYLSRSAFEALPKPVAERVLQAALQWTRGDHQGQTPYFREVSWAIDPLKAKAISLYGCTAIPFREWIIIRREERAIITRPAIKDAQPPFVWDQRFWVTVPQPLKQQIYLGFLRRYNLIKQIEPVLKNHPLLEPANCQSAQAAYLFKQLGRWSWPGLPVIYYADAQHRLSVLGVPALGYWAPEAQDRTDLHAISWQFCSPPAPKCDVFTIVSYENCTT